MNNVRIGKQKCGCVGEWNSYYSTVAFDVTNCNDGHDLNTPYLEIRQ